MAHFLGPQSWTIRGVFRWAATGILLTCIGIFAEENFRKLIEHLHWDEFLTSGFKAMPDFGPWIESKWFWLIFGVSIGMTAALWIVKYFPEQRGKKKNNQQTLGGENAIGLDQKIASLEDRVKASEMRDRLGRAIPEFVSYEARANEGLSQFFNALVVLDRGGSTPLIRNNEEIPSRNIYLNPMATAQNHYKSLFGEEIDLISDKEFEKNQIQPVRGEPPDLQDKYRAAWRKAYYCSQNFKKVFPRAVNRIKSEYEKVKSSIRAPHA